jgi:DNA-directed RNA polymerase specialized sigma24 family protein
MVLPISELDLISDVQGVTSELICEPCDECLPMTVLSLLPDMHALQGMSVAELADRCMDEIKRFQHGEASSDLYGVELFRRALKRLDSVAWEAVQQRFSEIMYGWMYQHPMRQVATRFDSEENYVAQAFARFWQATAGNQKIEFTTLAAIMRYLRASLNGTILDALRAYSRPREMPLPEPGAAEGLFGEEQDDSHELWEAIQSVLPDQRQQRVAYLLFHCQLKPRQVVQFCSDEFSDVGEIYRLRRNIFERLLRNADYIRWRLGH